MKEFPLVSVVTPSYNHVKYVQTTIESVINQTYKNIEYFVIDDGSKDSSQPLIRALSEKYNFYFETQENIGLVRTMNKLIKKCKGKYIAIIESDDIWTLDKIEKQVVFMENNPAIAACGGNALNINDKNEIFPYYLQKFKGYMEFNFKDILSNNHHLPSLTVMIRKEALDKVGLYDEEIIFVDYFMWLKITKENNHIALLPDLFGFYRVHESNTSKNNKKMFKSKVYLIKQYKGNKGYLEGLIKAYLHYYFHIIYSFMPFDFGFKRK